MFTRIREVMKTQQNEIIEKATEIIMISGIKELTIHNLADKLKIEESQLHQKFTKVDDILLILLLSFKSDFIDLMTETEHSSDSPENKLKIIFKELYVLFQQKPFYLDIIFDKNLKNRDNNIMNLVLWIREMAQNYLTDIINKGKAENTFKTKVSTSILVGKILFDFRTFMNDEQRFHEIMLEMKKLQIAKD
jgi:AcrR family transcriptional regulator